MRPIRTLMPTYLVQHPPAALAFAAINLCLVTAIWFAHRDARQNFTASYLWPLAFFLSIPRSLSAEGARELSLALVAAWMVTLLRGKTGVRKAPAESAAMRWGGRIVFAALVTVPAVHFGYRNLLTVYPYWSVVLAFGAWRFFALSGIARVALVCMVSANPLITYAGALLVALELMPKLSLQARRFSQAVLVLGAAARFGEHSAWQAPSASTIAAAGAVLLIVAMLGLRAMVAKLRSGSPAGVGADAPPAAPFRYPVNAAKMQRLRERKINEGERFPKVGILIVSYNASNLLAETVNRIPPELLDVLEEIFVFDDFSQDDTFSLAEELSRASHWKDKIKAFRNPRNLGYGGNQKAGFAYAIERGMDYVVLLHGDGQYAPELLPDLIYEAVENGKRVVFGSRMMNRLSALRGGMPLYKWVGNTILTHFENLILGLNLTEFHSGYRLYSTHVLRRLPLSANTDDFHFDTQIIIQCRALGEPPAEIAIPTYYGNEICHVNGLQYAFQVCLAVVIYRLHQLRIVHDLRYDVDQAVRYQFKASPYSSHGRILSLIPPQSTILDVGCGRGLLARKLAEKDICVHGMDSELPVDVWNGLASYEQVDLERVTEFPLRRQFDYVLMADILEHVRNATQLLQQTRPLLKSHGKLVASTGNVALWYMRLSLLLGRFNYGPQGILDSTHVRLYTLATFRRLIEEAGYRVTRVEYTGLPFEVVFRSTGKSHLLKLVDALYGALVRVYPKLFAYQFVIEAELRSLEHVRDEGKVKLPGDARAA